MAGSSAALGGRGSPLLRAFCPCNRSAPAAVLEEAEWVWKAAAYRFMAFVLDAAFY